MEGIKWTCTRTSFLQTHAIILRAAHCLIETEYKQPQATYVIINLLEATLKPYDKVDFDIFLQNTVISTCSQHKNY